MQKLLQFWTWLVAKVFHVRPRDSGPQTPNQVQGLGASANGQTQIDLTWTAIVGVSRYNVRRSGVSVGTSSSPSFSDTGLAAGTTYNYTASAINSFGEGPQSAMATARTVDAPSKPTGAISWNPGNYLGGEDVQYVGSPGYQNAYLTGLGNFFLGWQQLVAWNAIEIARDVYDFTQLNTLYDLCASLGKRLVIQILDRSFTDGTQMRLPVYLATEPGGGGGWYSKPTGGLVANLWLTPIMDRVIALDAAIGAWAKDKPFFEGVISIETDTGFTSTPPGYTPAIYMGQLQRRLDAVETNYPTKNYWQECNFIPTNQGAMPTFVNYIRDSRACLSSPDVKAGTSNGPANYSWAQHALHGYTYNGSIWVALTGPTLVGQLGIAADIEDPDDGGKTGHPSASQLYDQCHNYEQHNHTFWFRKMGPSGTGQQLYYDNSGVSLALDPPAGRWTPDIKTFIATGTAPTWPTVPSNYAAVITGET